MKNVYYVNILKIIVLHVTFLIFVVYHNPQKLIKIKIANAFKDITITIIINHVLNVITIVYHALIVIAVLNVKVNIEIYLVYLIASVKMDILNKNIVLMKIVLNVHQDV